MNDLVEHGSDTLPHLRTGIYYHWWYLLPMEKSPNCHAVRREYSSP